VGRSRAELDDPALERAVQAGDGAAISRVLELCLPWLRRRLSARLGLSTEDCEDLLQEVRLAFFTAATRYRGECSLRTFISGIACHECSDYLRARQRERNRDASPAADGLATACSGARAAYLHPTRWRRWPVTGESTCGQAGCWS
jgi:DNA-directed RNA polymerase specialized sigma24 family protein